MGQRTIEGATGEAAPARTGPLFFLVRVAMLVALLGVPILGTSFVLVSAVSDDIRSASAERADLLGYADVIDLVGAIGAVRRDVVDTDPAALVRDRTRADVLLGRVRGSYAGSDSASAFVRSLRGRWATVREHPDLANVDAALGAFADIGTAVDPNTQLDSDPNFAEQYAASVMLRSLPRLIVATSHTADVARGGAGDRLPPAIVASLAAARAIETAPREQIYSFLDQAASIDPNLRTIVADPERRVRVATLRFDDRIDSILRTFRGSPGDAARVERAARAAFDAQTALWHATHAAAGRLVSERYRAGIAKRRTIIALSLLAVVLGTIALAFNIRWMARRDRIEIASVKLESDRLRAELQRASAERALRLQAAQFQSVFENADLGIAIFEPSGAVREYNAALAHMFGERTADLVASRSRQVMLFEEERRPFTLEEMHANADGSTQWLALTFSGVYDDGTCQMVILLGRDVTEEKLFQQTLVHAASHDALTGILNRAAFERELARLCGDGAEAFALLYIDLDRFKPVNDRYGHAAGDAILVATADRLRSALATDDICVRLGGDEFAAIVRGANDAATLDRIAARVERAIAKPVDYAGASLEVTASIGIAEHRPGERCCTTLKHQADAALYIAKERGGNGHEYAGSAVARAAGAERSLVA